MSSVDRALTGDILTFRLEDEIRHLRQSLAASPARSARTLVKDGPQGPLSMTLVGLKPGGSLHEHVAQGPVTLHVLEGSVTVESGGRPYPLSEGSIAAMGAGIRHAVSSSTGGIFLLTVTGTSHSGAAFD